MLCRTMPSGCVVPDGPSLLSGLAHRSYRAWVLPWILGRGARRYRLWLGRASSRGLPPVECAGGRQGPAQPLRGGQARHLASVVPQVAAVPVGASRSSAVGTSGRPIVRRRRRISSTTCPRARHSRAMCSSIEASSRCRSAGTAAPGSRARRPPATIAPAVPDLRDPST
jgi:hypothetical protein